MQQVIKVSHKPNCKAVCTVTEVIAENQTQRYFTAHVSFYESPVGLLFRLPTGIVRTEKIDALNDAVDVALSNGFQAD